MPTSTYQVVTQQETVQDASGVQTFTVAAPTGKKPVGGGFHTRNPEASSSSAPRLLGSYPNGQNWVFEFAQAGVFGGWSMDLYVVCAEL